MAFQADAYQNNAFQVISGIIGFTLFWLCCLDE